MAELRVPHADGRAAASSGGWRTCEAVTWLLAFLAQLPLGRQWEAALGASPAVGPSTGLLSTQHLSRAPTPRSRVFW